VGLGKMLRQRVVADSMGQMASFCTVGIPRSHWTPREWLPDHCLMDLWLKLLQNWVNEEVEVKYIIATLMGVLDLPPPPPPSPKLWVYTSGSTMRE